MPEPTQLTADQQRLIDHAHHLIKTAPTMLIYPHSMPASARQWQNDVNRLVFDLTEAFPATPEWADALAVLVIDTDDGETLLAVRTSGSGFSAIWRSPFNGDERSTSELGTRMGVGSTLIVRLPDDVARGLISALKIETEVGK